MRDNRWTQPLLDAAVKAGFANHKDGEVVFINDKLCDMLHEFAASVQATERERCARIADEHATRNYPWGSENTCCYHAQAHWAERIADLIRKEFK